MSTHEVRIHSQLTLKITETVTVLLLFLKLSQINKRGKLKSTHLNVDPTKKSDPFPTLAGKV